MRRAALRVILVALAGAAVAAAQSFTGSILGTIRDSSGAVVPNASVTVVNVGTNVKSTVLSNEHGNYVAPLLPPGNYALEVSAAGFKKFVRDGVTLQVNQQARWTLRWQSARSPNPCW